MNIFLDTNVIIGYIYSLDALHSSSRKAIVRKSNNYYSFHVNQEVICVSRRKDREYSKFLIELGKIFNRYGDNDFIDLSEIHIKVNQFGQIGKLEVDNMHLAVDAFKVKTEFNNYSQNFESKHRKCNKFRKSNS